MGGSLAGLFTANLLRCEGWDVAIYERSEADLAGRGAGLGTREELFAVLRRIGIALEESIGAQVRSRLGFDKLGNVCCEVAIGSVTTAWDQVYRALRNALPCHCYQSGMKLERMEIGPRTSVAFFADGSRAEGDLLIGADGIHSTVRRLLMPDIRPCYAGYVAWRGVALENDVPTGFRDMVFRHMNFCFPAGELAISVPMPPYASSDGVCVRRAQFSWFRPTEHAGVLRQMCTDASGRYHGDAIPPPLIRHELLNQLRTSAQDLLPPQIAGLVTRSRQLMLQPIFDLESPRMVFHRVILVGDAAFVARPHVGTGVTKAALDARCLADELRAKDQDIDAALASYERKRLRHGRELVARGRYLGESLLRGVTRGDHETLMREFGSAGRIPRSKIRA